VRDGATTLQKGVLGMPPVKTLHVVDVGTDAWDSDLTEQMALMKKTMDADKEACCRCTIRGFNDDPRELWEIPEAKKLAQRPVDIGFIAWLEGSVLMPEIRRGPDVNLQSGMGALEVWALAKGKMKGIAMTLSRDDLTGFLKDYQQAIATSQKIVGP
jgi:hypothetical protein